MKLTSKSLIIALGILVMGVAHAEIVDNYQIDATHSHVTVYNTPDGTYQLHCKTTENTQVVTTLNVINTSTIYHYGGKNNPKEVYVHNIKTSKAYCQYPDQTSCIAYVVSANSATAGQCSLSYDW